MKKLFLVICISCFFQLSFSKPTTDTIKTGIYLKSLYDFNSSAFAYDVDLWMWFLYSNDSLNPLKTVEIENAKKYEYLMPVIDTTKKTCWASQHCKATINQNWDLQHYPFDHQILQIVLEESQSDMRKVILVADKNKFEYSNQIDIKGWQIDSSTIGHGVNSYESDFGDLSLKGKSEFSIVYYTIFLSRDSWALFFKLFTGCYVAFFVSFMVFFITPIHVDPRFGLSIGGLFAAVGNKYVVDSNMPESIAFTLVDKIHDITFIYILATILLSLISLKMCDKGKFLIQQKFDRKSARLILISYIGINALMIIIANNS